MAKRKKNKRRAKAKKSQPKQSRSTSNEPVGPLREGETMTVAWTLITLTTLGTQLAAGIVMLIRLASDESLALTALFRLLIVAAAIAGILSCALLPLVYRLRDDPPPKPIVAAGLLIAVVPIILVVWVLR